MMKAPENRLSSEPAETLDRRMAWRVLAQGQMPRKFLAVDPAFKEIENKKRVGYRWRQPNV